jgi:hypothetical protein
MSDISSSLNGSFAAVRALQQSNQSAAPTQTSQAIQSYNQSGDRQSNLFAPIEIRAVDGAATPLITIKFGNPPGSFDEIRQRIGEQVSAFYRIFYKSFNDQQEITGKVINSLKSQIEQVQSSNIQALQFRFASVETQFVDSENGVFGSTRQFALEVSAVSNDKVSATSINLFSLSGEKISANGKEAQTGLVTGLYTRQATIDEQQNPVLARQSADVDKIISSLRQTQESLLAYRDGDFRALNSLIGSLAGSGSTLTFAV